MYIMQTHQWARTNGKQVHLSRDVIHTQGIQGSHKTKKTKFSDFSLIVPWPNSIFPVPVFAVTFSRTIGCTD